MNVEYTYTYLCLEHPSNHRNVKVKALLAAVSIGHYT